MSDEVRGWAWVSAVSDSCWLLISISYILCAVASQSYAAGVMPAGDAKTALVGKLTKNCLSYQRGTHLRWKVSHKGLQLWIPAMNVKTVDTPDLPWTWTWWTRRWWWHPLKSFERLNRRSTTSSRTRCEDLPPFESVQEPDIWWGEVEDDRSFTCALNIIYYDDNGREIFSRSHLVKLGRLLCENCHPFSVPLLKAQHSSVWQWKLKWQCQLCSYRNLVLDRRQENMPLILNASWSSGKLDDLLHEGLTIQRQLMWSQQSQKNNSNQIARLFAKLMMEGKVRTALRLITQENGGGPLPLNNPANPNDPNSTQTVRDILIEKRPPKQPPKSSTTRHTIRWTTPCTIQRNKRTNDLRHDTQNGWCSRSWCCRVETPLHFLQRCINRPMWIFGSNC